MAVNKNDFYFRDDGNRGGGYARPLEASMDQFVTVETTVFALVPEYRQVKVRAQDGRQYALTEQTEGVKLEQLHEGQRVRCVVTRSMPRVVTAEAFA